MATPSTELNVNASLFNSRPEEVKGLVLHVDDDEAVSECMAAYLERSNFISKAFTNPREALLWFSENHELVDLVVLDLYMPGIDGRTLLKQVREIKPQQAVAFFSGEIDLDIEEDLAQEGVDKFFRKPFAYDELMRWIDLEIDHKLVANA